MHSTVSGMATPSRRSVHRSAPTGGGEAKREEKRSSVPTRWSAVSRGLLYDLAGQEDTPDERSIYRPWGPRQPPAGARESREFILLGQSRGVRVARDFRA